jgi:hypothetical protein
MKAPVANAIGVFLSGVLPEEGSPPPSSTPDINPEKSRPSNRTAGSFSFHAPHQNLNRPDNFFLDSQPAPSHTAATRGLRRIGRMHMGSTRPLPQLAISFARLCWVSALMVVMAAVVLPLAFTQLALSALHHFGE